MHCRPESWLDKIRLGASTFLELQEVRFGKGEVLEPRDSDLADELAALANSYGGVCALGRAGTIQLRGR